MTNQQEVRRAIMRIENIEDRFDDEDQQWQHILMRAKRITNPDKVFAYVAALDEIGYDGWAEAMTAHFVETGQMGA